MGLSEAEFVSEPKTAAVALAAKPNEKEDCGMQMSTGYPPRVLLNGGHVLAGGV